MLMSIKEPGMFDCCIPMKYRDPEIFEQKMEKYENALYEETMKPFINSGHAFVCFDSVHSMNTILKHFRMTPTQHLRVFYLGVRDKIARFCYWISGREGSGRYSQQVVFDARGRARSNFLRSNEMQEDMTDLIDYNDPQHVLIMHKASEPLDILWKNIGVIYSHFSFTRFFLFVFGFIIIIFLSSPAVMLAKLQRIDPTSFLKFDWTSNFGTMGLYLHKSFPPFCVLLINLAVIFLLDYACVIESYDSHSAYQMAVYFKTVIYMNLNMFIIPVLTLSSGGSTLYELFMANNFNLAKLLGELFIPKSGEFFIILLVQQGVFSAIFYSLNLTDIMTSYFTPALAFERRKIYND